MKLELKHIAPYLPYGLKLLKVVKSSFNCNPDITEIVEWRTSDINEPLNKRTYVKSCKPILRPLSDLKGELLEKFIIKFFNGEYWINEEYSEEKFMYELNNGLIKMSLSKAFEIKEWFMKHHFDVFGLIEQGLAVDINTL